ncbi:DUF6979 family protein [Vreelandella stevensii]|uniref:DUF6979 family protein n=1 Tax=Vreelandella stevensii TaxID=502821 RepID=UPI00192A8B0E|nr:hypothetical protein [Halomonas stevensii]
MSTRWWSLDGCLLFYWWRGLAGASLIARYHALHGDSSWGRKMAKYGDVALQAVRLAGEGVSPVEAWNLAAASMFPDQHAARVKGCPRSAFLGLCEEGYVEGIEAGKYTTSVSNKKYAIDLLKLLHEKPHLADLPRKQLWGIVVQGAPKQHNQQVEVVLALWRAGLLSI